MVSSAAPATKTPHDALFKSVFQQPESAAAELRHVLPAEHVAAIDWSTLKLEPGSYVDEALADQQSDLAFSANAQASGERVLVPRRGAPRFGGRCSAMHSPTTNAREFHAMAGQAARRTTVA